jgi:hypothetical protein
MKKFMSLVFLVIAVMIFNLIKPAVVKQIASEKHAEFVSDMDKIIGDGLRRGLPLIRERLPYRVSEKLVLFDVFVDGRRVFYFYRLDVLADEIEPNGPDLVRKDMAEGVCSSTDMRAMLSIGAVYAYRYFSSDGREIVAFEIDHRDCKWK